MKRLRPEALIFPIALAALAFGLPRVYYGLAWGEALKPDPAANPSGFVPFYAPDLDIIAQSRRTTEELTPRRIWFGSLPVARPDLAAYRPIHGMLLAGQYRDWKELPAARQGVQPSSTIFRSHSLLLFGGLCWLVGLFARSVLGAGGGAAALGALAATLLFMFHPMTSEAVNWAPGQGALIAGIGWVGALLLFQWARARRLTVWLAAPGVAAAYFIGFGAFEAAALLPLAILAVELLGPARPPFQPKTAKKKSASKSEAKNPPKTPAREVGFFRFLAYALPLGAVAAAIVTLRWIALDGLLLPDPRVRVLGEAGLIERLATGLPVMALGVVKLFAPLRPTFFYSLDYGESPLWPAALGAVVIVAAIALIFILRRRAPGVALGLALIVIPLLAVSHAVPLTGLFSERILILALPGLALIAGAAVAAASRAPAAADSDSDPAPAGPHPAVGAAAVIGLLAAIAVCAFVSFERAALWASTATLGHEQAWTPQNSLWAAEAARHPDHPAPLTYQLTELVSRHGRVAAPERVTELLDAALALAEPPDEDAIYQYKALYHLARGEAEDAALALDNAILAPAPHHRGYFASIGGAALQSRHLDQARDAFERELLEYPGNFDSLLGMALIYLSGQTEFELRLALATATDASDRAPPHRVAEAHMLRGRAAALLNTVAAGELDRRNYFNEGAAAFQRAIELDPRLAQAYLELAQLLVANGEYQTAEIVVQRARDEAQPATLRDFAAVLVDSRRRQGNEPGVRDLLREVARIYPFDVALQVYAGGELASMQDYGSARAVYARILTRQPNQPDALYGMAVIALTEANNMNQAAAYLAQALRANPGHGPARELLTRIRDQVEGRGASPTPTPPPPSPLR